MACHVAQDLITSLGLTPNAPVTAVYPGQDGKDADLAGITALDQCITEQVYVRDGITRSLLYSQACFSPLVPVLALFQQLIRLAPLSAFLSSSRLPVAKSGAETALFEFICNVHGEKALLYQRVSKFVQRNEILLMCCLLLCAAGVHQRTGTCLCGAHIWLVRHLPRRPLHVHCLLRRSGEPIPRNMKRTSVFLLRNEPNLSSKRSIQHVLQMTGLNNMQSSTQVGDGCRWDPH